LNRLHELPPGRPHPIDDGACDIDRMRLIKRLTLVVNDGAIEHVFYPVFSPHESARDVVRRLRDKKSEDKT